MGVCTDMMRQQAGNAPLPVGIDFQMAAGQSSNRRNQQPADNDARYKWDRVGLHAEVICEGVVGLDPIAEGKGAAGSDNHADDEVE